MADVSSIIAQLKQERDRVEKQLSGLNAALTAFAGVYGGKGGPVGKRKEGPAARQVLAVDSCDLGASN